MYEKECCKNCYWDCKNEPCRKWEKQEYSNEDELLARLKHNGKRLKELLNITDEDINKALKEVRKDWK